MTDNNGVLSGFTTANYAKIPNTFNPESNTWEQLWKITTGDTVEGTQYFIGNAYCFQIYLSDSLFKLDIGNGTAWTSPSNKGINAVNTNTTYYIKLIFDGTTYKVLISNNNEDFIEEITVEDSITQISHIFAIGYTLGASSSSSALPFSGSIDLNECYININGERWWDGANYITKNSNGHKFYNIADKSIIDNFYNQYGIAEFYGIDTKYERVFLPRNKYFHQLTGDTSKVNEMVEAGLPNITGTLKNRGTVNYTDNYGLHYTFDNNSAIYADGSVNAGFSHATNYSGNMQNINIDASRSNKIYGNSDTVQPQSSLKLLYYCVGNTKADTSWMKLTEQVEEGVKEIYDEKTKSLKEVNTLRLNSIQEITDTKNNGLQEIDTLRQTSVDEILDTKQNSLNELEDKRVSSNESIITTKEESIEEINTTTADLIDQARKWAVGTSDENEQGSAKFWAETAQLSSSNALFDTKVSDHVLEGPDAYGWALQGTYVYKDAVLGAHLGYPTFYEKCIEEKESATIKSVTLGSNTVTMYINNNGHQFYDISDKEVIDTWYNTYGIADYYGIDIENKCVFLPRNIKIKRYLIESKKSTSSDSTWYNLYSDGWLEQGGRSSGVATVKLPKAFSSSNYTVNVSRTAQSENVPFTRSIDTTSFVVGWKIVNQVIDSASVGFSWHASGYTNSVDIKEKLLYYCVGNTKADTSWIKLTEQVEAGVKEIEDKRVESIEDIDTLRQTGVNEIDILRQNSVDEIDNLREASINEIDTLRQESVQEVIDTKNTSLEEIGTLRLNSVEEVDTLRIDSVEEITNTKIDSIKELEENTLNGIHTLAGASNALNRNQITNCLIEVPQRIKYTLVDGALTILAGSQAIVPWGTKYPFETFGSLTINEENIASGFSSTNYIVFKEPFNPESNTWEQMWKITTGEDIVSVNNVLNRVPENLSSGFCFVIRDSKIGIYISSGTESYDIANSLWSEQTLEPNTTYYIKNSFDGSKYSMDISTDKINFTNYITVESTLTISPIKNKIGAYGTEEHHFRGLIHLNECYIKIGDEIWWEGKQRNLEEECPIGSIFLNNNFKVADTQFVNGKFFVWAELQNDTVVNCGNSGARMVFLGYDGIVIDSNIDGVYSVEPEGAVSRRWYDNNNNLMKQHDGTNWTTGVYLSLGFMLCTSDSNKTFISVDQTFNGLGYIGSTVWVDKDVKGLYPNYRNLDGTLRNIEYTTKNLKFLELNTNYTDQHIRLNETQLQIGTLFYDDIENANKLPNTLEYRGFGIVGSVSVSSGKITKFDIKLPFRAIGYSDLAEAHVVIQTYKNGTSWYRIWSDGWCEQGGRGNTANSNVTVNLLKAFKDTTYTVSIGNNTNGAYASPSSCDIVSNSQIRLRCAGTAEWMWQACGYIK